MPASAWTQRDALTAILVVTAAMTLLFLAGRQLIAELSRIPANSYYNRYQSRFLAEPNGAAYVTHAAERLRRIPPEHRGESEWRRLATALTMARTPGNAPKTSTEQQDAVTNALKHSIARNPVQVLGWSYLANSRMPPGGDCQNAMAALQQSYKVAPVEQDFIAYRLELAARCPLTWDNALLDALRNDLLALYRAPENYARTRAFSRWMGGRPHIQALARRLLLTYPETSARFERDIQRFSR